MVSSILRLDRYVEIYLARMTEWRAWSYRDGQLAHYLRDRVRITPPTLVPTTLQGAAVPTQSVESAPALPVPDTKEE